MDKEGCGGGCRMHILREHKRDFTEKRDVELSEFFSYLIHLCLAALVPSAICCVFRAYKCFIRFFYFCLVRRLIFILKCDSIMSAFCLFPPDVYLAMLFFTLLILFFKLLNFKI